MGHQQHTHAQMCINIYKRIYMNICIYSYMSNHVHMNIYTFVYIYMYMYMDVHK
jgi:REP element-mobilizing transposase RayT